MSILLVESNNVDAILMERTLELNDYNGPVSTVNDVAMATDYLQSAHDNGVELPQIIMLDVFIKEGYGTEFLSFVNFVKKLNPEIKVIIITVVRQLLDLETFESSKNVISVLDKPFNYEKFIDGLVSHAY